MGSVIQLSKLFVFNSFIDFLDEVGNCLIDELRWSGKLFEFGIIWVNVVVDVPAFLISSS